jgi:hypothetical protein
VGKEATRNIAATLIKTDKKRLLCKNKIENATPKRRGM